MSTTAAREAAAVAEVAPVSDAVRAAFAGLGLGFDSDDNDGAAEAEPEDVLTLHGMAEQDHNNQRILLCLTVLTWHH
jgi:hypothetical protein